MMQHQKASHKTAKTSCSKPSQPSSQNQNILLQLSQKQKIQAPTNPFN